MSESLQDIDRRRFVRFTVVVSAVGRAEQVGEMEFQGTIRNISGGGLMAEFPVQVRHGSTVHLTLQAGEGPLPVEGQVVWVDPPEERTRHGLSFPDPKKYALALQLFLSEYREAVVDTAPETTEPFDVWLLRRIRQAEEAGEVSRGLLTELQGELQAAGQRGEDAGHAVVAWQVADLAGIDRKHAAEVLDSIEAQPKVNRDILMRRIAEAWLEAQRHDANRADV